MTQSLFDKHPSIVVVLLILAVGCADSVADVIYGIIKGFL